MKANQQNGEKVTSAVAIRTAMIGGGTAYDVYFRVSDKPSRPLHGLQYATQVSRGGGEYFYSVADAIDPKARWSMEQGWAKYEAGEKLRAKASRLAVRIAKRVFPELRGLRELPPLWASWSLPSQETEVPVRITLPE